MRLLREVIVLQISTSTSGDDNHLQSCCQLVLRVYQKQCGGNDLGVSRAYGLRFRPVAKLPAHRQVNKERHLSQHDPLSLDDHRKAETPDDSMHSHRDDILIE